MLRSGGKTVATAGTAERLTDLAGEPFKRLDIIALGDNAGKVFVGDENVSAGRGWPLVVVSGVGTIFSLTDIDPYEIWIDVAVDGDGVTWGAVA